MKNCPGFGMSRIVLLPGARWHLHASFTEIAEKHLWQGAEIPDHQRPAGGPAVVEKKAGGQSGQSLAPSLFHDVK